VLPHGDTGFICRRKLEYVRLLKGGDILFRLEYQVVQFLHPLKRKQEKSAFCVCSRILLSILCGVCAINVAFSMDWNGASLGGEEGKDLFVGEKTKEKSIYICIYICVSVYIYVYMITYIHPDMYIYLHIYIYLFILYICTYTYIYVYIYIYVCSNMYEY